MDRQDIHPQLLEDCHHLGQLGNCAVLLNRNATMPWFILVPDSRLNDVLDLADEHRNAVMEECAAVSAFIKQVLGFEKVNFAGLGNQVPQMHLHIIGRTDGDACWPQPVWGNLQVTEEYDASVLAEWQQALMKMARLQPATL